MAPRKKSTSQAELNNFTPRFSPIVYLPSLITTECRRVESKPNWVLTCKPDLKSNFKFPYLHRAVKLFALTVKPWSALQLQTRIYLNDICLIVNLVQRK